MITGKEKVDRLVWHEVFVILPKQMVCGKYVFMQKCYRRWNYELSGWCDSSGYSGYDGGWEYRQ